MSHLRGLGDVALLFWAVPAILAPIEFAFVRDDDGRRLGFRHTELGRHLMAFMAAYAFVGVLGVLRFVTEDSLGWQIARVIGFVALVVVTWWRWLLVHRARVDSGRSLLEPRHRRHDDEVAGA
jgi:hypothetical protein